MISDFLEENPLHRKSRTRMAFPICQCQRRPLDPPKAHSDPTLYALRTRFDLHLGLVWAPTAPERPRVSDFSNRGTMAISTTFVAPSCATSGPRTYPFFRALTAARQKYGRIMIDVYVEICTVRSPSAARVSCRSMRGTTVLDGALSRLPPSSTAIT